ncbi:MAG: hypothetical protein AAB482_00865 [Patescibacteria group bacterium]
MVGIKKDSVSIKNIKIVVRQAVHSEVENLARIVAKGFESVDKRFEQVNKRFEQVDRRFESIEFKLEHIDTRLGVVEHDTAEIRRHFIYRDEFEDALARITLLEKKLNIKSGK